MFLSFEQLVVLLLLALILFGPEKLPEIGEKLGRWMAKLRQASQDLTKEYQPFTPYEPPPAFPTPVVSPPAIPPMGAYEFCPHCGQKLEQDFAFCPHCGQRLKKPATPEPPLAG